jgi:hypothetical protein
MISARAHVVLLDVVVFMTMVAKFESSPLSILGSWKRATDGLVDERTGGLEITPELDHELLKLVVRRALDCVPDACALWWRTRRARRLAVDIAWKLCTFLSVATHEVSSCQRLNSTIIGTRIIRSVVHCREEG